MNNRLYGNTGKYVSEIGFGAWQIGDMTEMSVPNEQDAVRLVQEAVEKGVNFFDTAPAYGTGRSEEILGKALKGKRDSVIINTKFGHSDGKTDFSAGAIEASVINSMKRLQTDYIDSVILHNPPFELLNGNSPHYEVFEKMKEQGRIGAYGASIDTPGEMYELMNTTKSGVIEVMFNMFYQDTAEAFKMAADKNIALIIKVPLDSGWLSGKYNADTKFDDIRDRWTEQELVRRAELLDMMSFVSDGETTMTQAALRFILSYREVSTVIPGIKSLVQLDENISASEGEMPADHVEMVKQIWRRELKDNVLGW